MKDLTDILNENKFKDMNDSEQKAKIVATSLAQYLKENDIITTPILSNSIYKIDKLNGSKLSALTNPTKNEYFLRNKIKYSLLKDLIKECIGKKEDYEIKIELKGQNYKPSPLCYALYLNKEKVKKIIKANLNEPKKVLQYEFNLPKKIDF